MLEPGSVWKHTKRGTRYEILSMAGSQVDENETDMVVYQGLNDGGRVWVRPVDRFLEKAATADGANYNRFELMELPPAVGCCEALSRFLGLSSGNYPPIVIQRPLPYQPQESLLEEETTDDVVEEKDTFEEEESDEPEYTIKEYFA